MTVLPQDYLRTLDAVRERCMKVYEQAIKGQLHHFDVDETKLDIVVEHVLEVTLRQYPDVSQIPAHSRLRHFDAQPLLDKWRNDGIDKVEQARRLIDLVIVSVLVDAGAGQVWKYQTSKGPVGRSEGLAIAATDMFQEGYFSSVPGQPEQVDAQALSEITVDRMTKGFQVTPINTMVGLEGRSKLLQRLGDVLKDQRDYFPASEGQSRRPGNLVDYLLPNLQDNKVHLDKLWEVVMGLAAMWPGRLAINGVQLGDVWPCDCLKDQGNFENLVPFHKLSQWLTYSLVEALETTLGITVEGTEKLTGLPEYRNGGILIDHGLMVLKPADVKRGTVEGEPVPVFEGSDPAIVEWRALTVIYMDIIRKELEIKLGRPLALAQVLQGGTWSAGRDIAAKLRPDTAGPPINLKSDGTIF
ncbi:uncharacterized protein BYT42DRAFT_557995 [Radiomyces spectabilis]|uniref:uncharacterized protein n=1 Tax=Radiomyces spectabilis TaxID=64574 RepID=UPI00221E6CB8|nr:uncharacterized protein BYT42DRAFT_557995 [Radiomyces spectabilis]KAI8391759.1 hypothetical protein BYT42DRAFT_557995 [Radiomyces spectabilis]